MAKACYPDTVDYSAAGRLLCSAGCNRWQAGALEFSTMHILFVDDLPDTCEVYKLAFRMTGHTARIARDGVEAVHAVQDESFDAIIMDVEMPRLNGWEAVQQIRLLPNGQSIPIVMFTAYGAQADHEKAKAVGADDLLQKPVLPRELIDRIKGLMR